MIAELRGLAELILTEVHHIESTYSPAGKEFPSLNSPNAEPFIEDPKFQRSANVTIAAASRLIASLRNPHATVHMLGCSMYTSAFMHIAVEANITEALKEAGPQGMHVRELAAKVQMNPNQLSPVLRYLCAMHHTYQEVAPDVFTNNRISMTLDTGKAFEDVKDRDDNRYELSKGSAAIVGLTGGHWIQGVAKMSEVALSPETAFHQDPTNSPLLRGLGIKGSYYEWLKHPKNKKTIVQFGAAMRNVGEIWPPSFTASAFDWDTLPPQSLVVDVGGGYGGSTLALAKAHPNLRYIIQDKPEMVAGGEQHWNTAHPKALKTGLVKFQAHDFFQPQPVKDAAAFLLRLIFHNWNDAASRKILDALRAAATPNTRLILLELVIPYTCKDQGYTSISGGIPEPLPDILYGNPGPSNATAFATDAQMFNLFLTQARTIGQWVELLRATGWKIVEIREAGISSIICQPS